MTYPQIIVRQGGTGKTAALMEWMREPHPADEHRVCVATTKMEADRLYRTTLDAEGRLTWAQCWQFVAANDLRGDALRGRGPDVRLGIDNLDLVLRVLPGFPVDVATWTGSDG